MVPRSGQPVIADLALDPDAGEGILEAVAISAVSPATVWTCSGMDFNPASPPPPRPCRGLRRGPCPPP